MSRSEKKQETRQRILDAAGRGFRKGGYDGIGVDGLAKQAGVTSGASMCTSHQRQRHFVNQLFKVYPT